MDWFSRIKESPNYDRLRNSLEFRSLRRNALFIGGFTAVALLVVALEGVGTKPKSVLFFIMVLLVFVPVSLYYVYRLVELFLHIERWAFTEVTLDKPHMGSRGSASFTVTLRDRSGRERQRETSALFSTNFEPVFDDCVNKKALIGYNDETDTVAVIKILP